MTRPDKLYAKLLANPRAAISFRDFEKLLAAFGFASRMNLRRSPKTTSRSAHAHHSWPRTSAG